MGNNEVPLDEVPVADSLRDLPEEMNRQYEQARTPEGSVGREVAALRRARGWSQTDLAEQMASRGFDLHQTTVAKLEHSTRPIRLNEVVALADIFGVELADLVSGAAEAEQVARSEELRRAKRAWTQAQVEAGRLRSRLAEAEAKAETAKMQYRALVQGGDDDGRTAQG